MPQLFKVHIVEDDTSIAESLLLLVQIMGYEAEVFSTAEGFLGADEPHAHSCLILDMSLPDIHGLELMRRLGTTGKALPTIVITGNKTSELESEALALGSVAVLEKPFYSHEVRAILRRIADQNRSEHDVSD